jgi:hypothetical protein
LGLCNAKEIMLNYQLFVFEELYEADYLKKIAMIIIKSMPNANLLNLPLKTHVHSVLATLRVLHNFASIKIGFGYSVQFYK